MKFFKDKTEEDYCVVNRARQKDGRVLLHISINGDSTLFPDWVADSIKTFFREENIPIA